MVLESIYNEGEKSDLAQDGNLSNISKLIEGKLSSIPDASLDAYGRKKKYTLEDLNNAVASTFKREVDGDLLMVEIDNDNDLKFVTDAVQSKRYGDDHATSLDDRKHGNKSHAQRWLDDALEKDTYNSNTVNEERISIFRDTSVIFVIDTNFIISHLNTLEKLKELSQQFQFKIVIPSTVVRELDGLKHSTKENEIPDSSNDHLEKENIALGKLARWSNDWIFSNLSNRDPYVKVQKLNERINKDCIKDDAILDCCLYYKQLLKDSPTLIILMSNDKNLCAKALTEDLLTISFRKEMNAELIANTVYQEYLSQNDNPIAATQQQQQEVQYPSIDFESFSIHVYTTVVRLLILIIHHIMLETFNINHLRAINYSPPTNIEECLIILQECWSGVFSEYFKHSSITALNQESWNNFPLILSTKPTNIQHLQSFIQFWVIILNSLFMQYPNSDERISLQQEINNWQEILNILIASNTLPLSS